MVSITVMLRCWKCWEFIKMQYFGGRHLKQKNARLNRVSKVQLYSIKFFVAIQLTPLAFRNKPASQTEINFWLSPSAKILVRGPPTCVPGFEYAS